jgi:GNAT superfamily N-acetyltransferase
LILALAEFEKLPPPDLEAQQRLVEHGFGAKPRFESWLAFCPGSTEPVAYALLFETYSSFLAQPTLYLEDIFVLPSFRHRGIGTALLQHCITLAQERGCGRMEWVCLDWNTKAQAAYKQLGALQMNEWILYRLTQPEMAKALGASSQNQPPLTRD